MDLFLQVSFLIDFLFYLIFQPSTLDLLEMKLHNFFYLLFINISQSHDLGCGFNKLARVDLGCFFLNLFLIDFFFQFHLSTLNWLEIKFCNCFLFSFYTLS
jgi:hypothetical protein